MGTMISMISKPHKWLTNKRAAGMDEQRGLLYRGSRVNLEFHRSEDPFSCATISEESEVRSREHTTTVSKLGFEELGVVSLLDQFYLFILFFFLLIRKNRVLSSFPNSWVAA